MVLGLSGGREDNGYVRFHRAVYRVLRWIGAQGDDVDPGAAAVEFETAWREIGPFDHPLEALYRASAQRILDQARGRSRIGIDLGRFCLALDDHTITVPIDEIEGSGGRIRLASTSDRAGAEQDRPTPSARDDV